jgi:CubicO group peptidase (beta-lactamase class C family)
MAGPAAAKAVLLLVVALQVLTAPGCRSPADHPGHSLGLDAYSPVRDLYGLAERYRSKHRLPALGVGVIHRGRIVGLGMTGERTAGTGDLATLNDAFDVASCSKTVTATMAAVLVEDGAVRWDTTLSDAFPELRDSMHPAYAGVTLEQLLRHRSGLGHEMNRNVRWAGWNQRHAGRSPTEQRRLFAAEALARPPRYPPGSETSYTSDGYVIAGTMLERAAGRAWELLVRQRLFGRLGLETMTYGPATGGRAPTLVSGHEEGEWLGFTRSFSPDPAEYGAPPFGSPAGFLYSSAPDLLRYVGFHIDGANGRTRLLQAASFERLHAYVEGERFALGWEIDLTRDSRGRIIERSLYHGGYSGRSRANIWFVPETQWGTVIVTNHGRGDKAITDDIFYGLLREFGLRP